MDVKAAHVKLDLFFFFTVFVWQKLFHKVKY